MGSPVFGAVDRVGDPGGGDGLPAELKGKTPAEIAAFYQQRENTLRAELDARPPASVTPPPAPPPQPTNTEFWNDPNASVDRKIAATAVSKAEFERLTTAAQRAMIWAAKSMCKENHKDFHRIEKEIDTIMSRVPEFGQTDPSMWETVYIQAKGFAHDRLAAEDRANPPVMSAEPGNPGSTAPPVAADLYKVTIPGVSKDGTVKSAGRVADMLGITHDAYRKADKELQGDGLLPLTIDNRRGESKRAS
jgi:hypothetical protein